MGKNEKRIKKMRQNPKNIRFEEIEKLLESLDYVQLKGTGSHRGFRLKRKGKETLFLNIPFKRPHINKAYVKKILSQLEEAGLIEYDE